MKKRRTDGLPAPAEPDRRLDPFLACLLAVTVVLMYWPVLRFPYIQDDWEILYRLSTAGTPRFLADAISGVGELFYRPVGQFYFALLYGITGDHPVWFHIVNILLLISGSLLVVSVTRMLLASTVSAWVAGYLYASAWTVHLDATLWMVGFFDLGGVVLFILSLLLFLKRKEFYSALVFLIALLTKEATFVLPFVLIVYLLIVKDRKNTGGKAMLRRFMPVVPHVAILAGYLLVRVAGISQLAGGENQSYSLRFSGSHIGHNLTSYATWLGESMGPSMSLPGAGVWVSAMFVVSAAAILMRRRTNANAIAFALVWVVAGCAALLFVPSHAYRYYLVYSLAGFIIIVVETLGWMMDRVNTSPARRMMALVVVTALNSMFAGWSVWAYSNQGVLADQMDGSNNLIRKGSVVQETRTYMLIRYPVLPRGAAIIFDWLPTSCFAYDYGPRLWYGDTTLTVYEAKTDSSGVYISNPKLTSERLLAGDPLGSIDRSNAFVLQVRGGRMNMYTLDELTGRR